ncbi:MAG: plasmid mobilization protein [Alishewanella aestuarii]
MPQAKTFLSEEDKAAWSKFCKSADKSEAVMLQKMILKVLTGSIPTETSSSRGEPKSGKVTVRLTEHERLKMINRANDEGYSNITSWSTAVIRSALHHEPVLTNSEVTALRESNRELSAIGRNLNQVARALNIEFRDSDKLKLEGIEGLIERIEQHKDTVADLLTRSMNRWHDNG